MLPVRPTPAPQCTNTVPGLSSTTCRKRAIWVGRRRLAVVDRQRHVPERRRPSRRRGRRRGPARRADRRSSSRRPRRASGSRRPTTGAAPRHTLASTAARLSTSRTAAAAAGTSGPAKCCSRSRRHDDRGVAEHHEQHEADDRPAGPHTGRRTGDRTLAAGMEGAGTVADASINPAGLWLGLLAGLAGSRGRSAASHRQSRSTAAPTKRSAARSASARSAASKA